MECAAEGIWFLNYDYNDLKGQELYVKVFLNMNTSEEHMCIVAFCDDDVDNYSPYIYSFILLKK